jgi:hypothetical protein
MNTLLMLALKQVLLSIGVILALGLWFYRGLVN